ncbi:hypothetical protein HPP92_011157 [Vanilla planifolia]|uniref:DEK-C domain-containing protein n=1 Tax=Vanilla planifolia TaxID=51239 RepID=A0A835R1B9_VANPL|nr:hypothetical protein HPP92_011157 [Vanilla planifolia]
MRARVKHFKEQADSFTLEGVRRALEKDMGLDIFSLDAHKSKYSRSPVYSGEKKIPGEEEEPKQPKDSKSSCDVDENAEESLADDGIPNSKLMKTEEPIGDAEISEDIIKKAIKMRGSYFKENLEKISLAKVRRQLEEDLNVKKNTLDAYKNFISDFLYKFLQTPETLKTENDIKKKIKESFQNKKVEKVKGRPIVATEDLGSSNLDDDINGEIRSVKKRKETARELEGIDMSNIVSTSRRRSTSNYIPVPKQKIEIESDEYSEEDEVEGDEEDADNTDEAGEGSGESHDESEGGADEESD